MTHIDEICKTCKYFSRDKNKNPVCQIGKCIFEFNGSKCGEYTRSEKY